ncbi:hypothetical protein [Rubeoparvulum massiliense]|uniref:hypothetical protein n=1 Tax=Rubeoparvulum massiliense TaxID=1631346 RepID=UPI00065E1F4A|nr:hypothetical protein [Rubeoparvulum massiliense]
MMHHTGKQTAPQLGHWGREWLVALFLLILPTFYAYHYSQPYYSEYVLPGEIVSLQEFGLDSSLYMTYVNSGYTYLLIDAEDILEEYGEEKVDFFELAMTPEEEEMVMMEEGEFSRLTTLENAFSIAQELTQPIPDEAQAVYDELLHGTAEYYGDSLGLMVALGLIEEWKGLDFSQGGRYKIAGTGTMENNHEVGSIGGMRQKIWSAEASGVDYFFIPRDKGSYYYLYEGISNQEEAEAIVEEYGLQVELVPVANLEEALEFLEYLRGENSDAKSR